jgi:hypothetical protein
MRLANCILAIADISGYTSFIKNREVSLLHAEQIISELLEAVIDGAQHPLTLNKLEGDAALLYAETGPDPGAAAKDVLRQVGRMFRAFSACSAALGEARRNCSCEACANISGLRLKAFLHQGEIAIKRIRQFEELAGEEVILIHRMLKNQVPGREYVLLSDAFHVLVQDLLPGGTSLREEADGLGTHTVWVVEPGAEALAAL